MGLLYKEITIKDDLRRDIVPFWALYSWFTCNAHFLIYRPKRRIILSQSRDVSEGLETKGAITSNLKKEIKNGTFPTTKIKVQLYGENRGTIR